MRKEEQQRKSLIEEIDKYTDSKPVRFHTPGHKGLIHTADITELDFSDDYFNPTGAIREIMNLGKKFYKSKETFLSTSGSTLGIHSAVHAVKPAMAIFPENSHKCVYNAVELAGAVPFVIKNNEVNGIKLPLSPEQVQSALKESRADAVIITSPDYFGFTADLKSIKKICVENGAKLIVDAAHGAHFPASVQFPDNYVHCDISVTSAHKTLEALTSGAFINIYNSKYIEQVKKSLELFATSSPSYLIMASLESALESAMNASGEYSLLYLLINELKKKYPFVKNNDFTRLVLDCSKIGGGTISNGILREMNIYSEKVFEDHIIFIVTSADSADEITQLDKALSMLFT